ncbi:GIY-YIG nuclease family protein [Mesobacillus maritimus]|uniref:GIY-YIG nuclease family protein n=1 Tax=Mesobacillus maritimus TaxID=1643336 RepID=UPI002041C790|nr:GIY-YIG nuclease family protein [Mesobacillus maritimus]MCM3588584.1 GIY-YIG nuclease family protein [Mesobacillus maritimus]MCM3671601.1 GIY-YIG nuclease family protein [Mesobacillus maritimus]
MEQNEHYFYVLLCQDGSYYAGYTNNLGRRIRMHNEGKGAKYTRGRGPVKLIYSKSYSTKSEALKAEYAFKQLARAKKEKFLTRELGEEIATTKEL